MLCEKCKIREANVFYTEIIDGDQKNEHHLCSKCAGEIDQYSSLFEKEENSEYRQIVCPTCNTSYDDFIKNSMFGCKDCFEVFNLLINDNIKQIHGNDTHVGKTPKNYHKNDKILPKSIVTDSIDNIFNNEDKKIENLKHKLEDAIKKEDFAQAAILRDKIKTIKEDKEDVV